MTDVTGFGLLGHLRNMTAASGVTARIWADAVPVLAAARRYVQAGIAPGGTHANWRFLRDWISYDEAVPQTTQLLLCDAQTSGGLLAAVPAGLGARALQCLAAAGVTAAAIVGYVEGPGDGHITVAAGGAA